MSGLRQICLSPALLISFLCNILGNHDDEERDSHRENDDDDEEQDLFSKEDSFPSTSGKDQDSFDDIQSDASFHEVSIKSASDNDASASLLLKVFLAV